MTLTEESRGVIGSLKQNLPFMMPQFMKQRIVDMICINAACVCHERAAREIRPDDIHIGMARFLDADFIKRVNARSGLTAEQLDRYRCQAVHLDHSPLADFMRDLMAMAGHCQADYQAGVLAPTLECFKNCLEDNPIYIKTTRKPGSCGDLNIRTGHPGKRFDFIAMAAAAGLPNLASHSSALALAALGERVQTFGNMVDFGLDGKIQKIYAFHAQKPQAIAKIATAPHLPSAIRKNQGLLRQLGFSHFGISGFDFKHQSVNLYFHLRGPAELSPAKIKLIFSKLGFDAAPAEIAAHIQTAAMLYFTFSPDSDRIERVCFTNISASSLPELVKLEPSIKKFVEESPFHSKKRNILMGLTFQQHGFFLKPELDYKGTMNLPGFSPYSGLFNADSGSNQANRAN